MRCAMRLGMLCRCDSFEWVKKPGIDRMVCDACGKCADVCSHDALKLVGREMGVDEVLAEVEKDRAFYRRSGGGVTIGGGEPLVQFEFTTELLKAARTCICIPPLKHVAMHRGRILKLF